MTFSLTLTHSRKGSTGLNYKLRSVSSALYKPCLLIFLVKTVDYVSTGHRFLGSRPQIGSWVHPPKYLGYLQPIITIAILQIKKMHNIQYNDYKTRCGGLQRMLLYLLKSKPGIVFMQVSRQSSMWHKDKPQECEQYYLKLKQQRF